MYPQNRMHVEGAVPGHAERSAAKQSAALSSVLAAFGITLLKLITGLFTGSLGMLSEAAHSGVDLLASALWVAWEAVHRISHRAGLNLRFSFWPFLVLLLSIAVDLTRARTLRR